MQLAFLLILFGYSLNFPPLILANNITQKASKQRNTALEETWSQTHPIIQSAKVPVQLVVANQIYEHGVHHSVSLSDVTHHSINIRNIIRADIAQQCIRTQGMDIMQKRCDLYLVSSISSSKFKFINVSDRSFTYDNQQRYSRYSDTGFNRIKMFNLIFLLKEPGMCAYSIPIEC